MKIFDRRFRFETLDGEPAARLRLADGSDLSLTVDDARDWEILGYTQNAYLRGNGKRNSYATIHAHSPEPSEKGAPVRNAARLLIAMRLVREERAGGDRAPAKGWTAGVLSGNARDLRRLERREAKRCRNSFRDVWDVRKRWELLDNGVNPNTVFASARREARNNRRKDDDV